VAPDDKGVRGVYVDVFFEPPDEGAEAAMAQADALASLLGLVRVGAAFTHAPRKHTVDAKELIQLCAAQRQARAGPASALLSPASDTAAAGASAYVLNRKYSGGGAVHG